MSKIVCLTAFICVALCSWSQQSIPAQQDRWRILPDGSIEWPIDNRLPHNDHVEMSGEKISMWVQYGVNADSMPTFNRTFVFPSFRLLPVRTIASMMYNITDGDLPRFLINDRLLKAGVYNAAVTTDQPEKVTSIKQKGLLMINSEIGNNKAITLRRTLFPSIDKPVAIEKWVFTNTGKQPVKIEMEYLYREVRPAAERTTPVQHSFIVSTVHEGLKTVAPGDSVQFAILYQAIDKNNPAAAVDVNVEQLARQQRVQSILSLMQLETPDPVLNTAFAFAKVRATESIYKTKGGYLHGPGGLRYYAAIWANDQAEYINPFFAMLGDETGNRSAMNAYRWFARYMNPDYKPIPSSIIAEGDATWHGAKDRGDMAMIAYGVYALRGVLAAGETEKAMQFLRYYSQRRLLGEHVPYPVEAYPEGNQRHLSAESGLYCRIYTEGLFGIRPVAFNSFECSPRLPNGWNQMALRNMHSFGTVFDITVNRTPGGKLSIVIKKGEKEKKYVVKEGAMVTIQL